MYSRSQKLNTFRCAAFCRNILIFHEYVTAHDTKQERKEIAIYTPSTMDHRGGREKRSRKHQAPCYCSQQRKTSVRNIMARGKGPQIALKRDLWARPLATKDGDSVSTISSTCSVGSC